MPIEFSVESKQRVFEALQRYFRDEFEEDLGLLRTEKLFDFIVGLIGATIYNQAVGDAQAWLHGKLLDLEGDLHQQVEAAP